MRQAARAIVVKDNQLLVMRRQKFGQEYDTLPGGNVSISASAEESLVKELFEETSINVSNPRLVFVEHAGDPYGDQLIYKCDYEGGEPAVQPDSDEAKLNEMGQNIHTPLWVSLEELANADALPFRSERLKWHIIDVEANGYSDEIVEFWPAHD